MATKKSFGIVIVLVLTQLPILRAETALDAEMKKYAVVKGGKTEQAKKDQEFNEESSKMKSKGYGYLDKWVVEGGVFEDKLTTTDKSELSSDDGLNEGEYQLKVYKEDSIETSCFKDKLDADDSKSLKSLYETNKLICESKRDDLLEFCSCVTLSSAKKVGDYSPLGAKELGVYKKILEDITIYHVAKDKINDLLQAATTVQKTVSDADTWKVTSSEPYDVVLECSPEEMPNFMDNLMQQCGSDGVSRMKEALRPFGLDIFPDKGEDPKKSFNDVFGPRLKRRVKDVPVVTSIKEVGDKVVKNNERSEQMIAGNKLIFEILKQQYSNPKDTKIIEKLGPDKNKIICQYLMTNPYESYDIIRDFYINNRKKDAKKKDSLKNFKNCTDATTSKNIVLEYFPNVLVDFESSREELYGDNKILNQEMFDKIVTKNYQNNTEDLTTSCRQAKKDLVYICKIAERSSFSPATMFTSFNGETIEKAAKDAFAKYRKNLPPGLSDKQFKAQMDEVMCYTHGDANGLVTKDGAAFAQGVRTFQKYEDIEYTHSRKEEDLGASWESEDDTERAEKSSVIKQATNESMAVAQKTAESYSGSFDPGYGKGSSKSSSSSVYLPADKSMSGPPLVPQASAETKAEAQKKVSSYDYTADFRPEGAAYSQLTHSPSGGSKPPEQIKEAAEKKLADVEAQKTAVKDYGKQLSSAEDKKDNDERLKQLQAQIDSLKAIIEDQKKAFAAKKKAEDDSAPPVAKMDDKSAKKDDDKKATPSSGGSGSAVLTPVSPGVASYSGVTSFGASGSQPKDKPFVILPAANGKSSGNRYASFNVGDGKEVVVDLASPDVLVISEFQLKAAQEEGGKDFIQWYEKYNEGPIYIMFKDGSYKYAKPSVMKDDKGKVISVEYKCLNNKKFEDCDNGTTGSQAMVKKPEDRPLTKPTIKPSELASHRDLIKEIQKATASKVKPLK